MQINKTFFAANRQEWRAWLQEHFQQETEVWLISYKNMPDKEQVTYEDAVEEVLCFGWIDSIIQRIDDEKYARKYTPRTNNKKWSVSNLIRMRKVIAEGRMTEAGLAKIDPALLFMEPRKAKPRLSVPKFMKDALLANPRANENFQHFAPSHRRQYIGWIMSAKQQPTRLKRLDEALTRLEQNLKLGLK
jgi:uncharacterized protein YdeI (YjbR/CyaY-like superfamily)